MALPATFPMRIADGKTVHVPAVGFGTWAPGKNEWCKDAVLTALKVGYRHLDCAWLYGVDEAVGAAIHESGVPRSEIFITTKFWPHFAAPENVEKCLDLSLRRMGLDYIDLYLAHWPFALKPTADLAHARTFPGAQPSDRQIAVDPTDGSEVFDYAHMPASIAAALGQRGSFVPTWTAMKALVRTGKCRAVGVSNFAIAQIEELLPHASHDDVPLSCNQIEAHPWLPNEKLIAFLKSRDVLPVVYCPFAPEAAPKAVLLQDETVVRIARSNGMAEGQVLLSWAIMRGTLPLAKSQTPERIKANLEGVKRLPDEDFEALNRLHLNSDACGRTINYGRNRWGVTCMFGD
ncbi:MAG: hypothetical protein M1816_001696 [Peltula sp. TS41687]|nr:MAG: hypothetical protein M1816_001696 [Peltula sp. TS41687]